MQTDVLQQAFDEILAEDDKIDVAEDNVSNWVRNVDFRGHSMHKLGEIVPYQTIDPYYKREIGSSLHMYTIARDIAKESNSDSVPEHVKKLIDKNKYVSTLANCGDCGNYLKFDVVGNDLVSKTQCEFAGGMQPYSVLLDVPSGKIVFANDLRSLVEVEDGSFYVNHRIGIKNTTLAYAKAGMVHISVGNSCPSVYKNADGYIVANIYEPEYDDSKTEEQNDIESAEWENSQPKKFGTIITDLWWYSAMDYDYFMQRCNAENRDMLDELQEDWTYFILDVEPGTYKFTDNLPLRDTYGQDVIYSNITMHNERVPFIPPVDSYNDTYDNSHFKSYLEKHSKKNYFYGKKFRCLSHMFVTSGGGYDWVHGRLSDQTRRSDAPYKVLIEPSYGHARYADIPTYKNFPEYEQDLHLPLEGLAGTGSNYCGSAGDVPENVDPVWLAACMMYINTMIVNFDTIKLYFEDHSSNTKPKSEFRAEHLEMCRRILDMLCEIGEKRNLFDGTLQSYFDQLKDLE